MNILKIIVVLCCVVAAPVYADKGKIKGKIKVELSPAGSFDGEFDTIFNFVRTKNGFKANEIRVKIDGIKTGIELRDNHLKKRLNCKSGNEKYVRFLNVVAAKGRGVATAVINCIKKKISFSYKETGGGKALAKLQLNIEDFNIKDVKYMGIGVKKSITLLLKFYPGKKKS